jgi:hypothetical protein
LSAVFEARYVIISVSLRPAKFEIPRKADSRRREFNRNGDIEVNPPLVEPVFDRAPVSLEFLWEPDFMF